MFFKSTNIHFDELVRGATLAFILKIIGSILTFTFNVFVARFLGAEGAGIYYLALSITIISSVIARVGLDNALLRYIAVKATAADWASVSHVHALGMRLAVITGFIITVIIFFTAPWITENLFNKVELTTPLRWMSLSILPFALYNLQAASLKGLKRIRDAMFVQSIAAPLIGLILLLPLANLFDITGVALSYLIGALVAYFLGVVIWNRTVSKEIHKNGAFSLKELWSSCRPLYVVSLINSAILPWSPLFLLGIWVSSSDVGIFGAAVRTSMLISFFLVAMNNVIAPKFAGLYANGEIKTLGKLARRSAALLTIFASPILFVMIFASDWVMSLYGQEFRKGGEILIILSVGQLINAFCGPVANLLIMSGNEKNLRFSTIISLVILLLLCISLIPSFGMEGAAFATAAGIITNNLVAVYFVRRELGISYPVKF